MPYKEFESKKLYYTMGEMAAEFDVAQSLIRFWEKEFDILQPKKNKKGNRLFTPEDMENFRLIHNLVKERGFTIEGAKNELKSKRNELLKKQRTIDSLQTLKGFLLELKEQL